MIIKKQANPIVNPSIVLREEFDDWAVLFDPDSGQAFGINPVSVLVWKLLDGKHSAEAIVSEVKARCQAVPEEVSTHVDAFIQKLLDKGFLGYEV